MVVGPGAVMVAVLSDMLMDESDRERLRKIVITPREATSESAP
jgi:hypothetical protein